ncbi:MAG: hypothetical protein M1827_003578 [Pycnora praestabilis]|nr:MAG: hypothetical protein M1827_003578 [Pycnora praestabilis]
MDLSWLLGHAAVAFYHSEDVLHVKTKSGTKQTLLDVCKSVTPPCRLNPLLFNGHLQTFMTVVKNYEIPIYYKRKIFTAEDLAYAGSFAVDFVVEKYNETDELLPPRTTHFSTEELEEIGSQDSKPMLVVLHGLSGGSHEIYLRHVLAPLVSKEEGWEACVVNSRGCAMSKITSGVLYNARASWDMRQVVKWLRLRFPNRPLFGIGFSLGANIMTNYIGEEGSECVLKAAVVCSNPWNLEAGSLTLQRSWLGSEVYSKTMATNLKKLCELHVEQLSKNPRINMERVRKTTYLHEFDREVQGPTWGYPTEGAYYRDASSTDSLLAIKIPFFAIHAEDDPIAAKEAIPYQEFTKNPYAVLCTTSLGGHLSWFEVGGGRWFTKPVIGFLQKMAEDIDLDRTSDNIVNNANGTGEPQVKGRPTFSPMRRKLHVRD